MAGDVITKTEAFRLKFKTILLLTYMLAICYSAQASYNVTVLLFVNESYDQHFYDGLQQMLRQYIFSQKSGVIDFRLLKANVTGIDRGNAGVFESLAFTETLTSAVDGAIFVNIAKEELVFSSLLDAEFNILTVGLFQDEKIIQTQESSVHFTRTTFPSVYHYATSAWKIITKHRWRTICLILSACYEGKKFAEQMARFAFQEKWEILKIVWLMDDMIGHGTEAELKDVLTYNSDVTVMHSRLGNEERFFKLIQEVGVSNYKTVWIVTDITTQLTTESNNLPEGLLKISLGRPEHFHDYSIYAFQDVMMLFKLSFEESVKECCKNSDVTSCEKGINSQKIRRIAKRRMAQISLSGKSSMFDTKHTANKYSTFTIWNLKEDGVGEKKWFPVGMGTSSGIAMETYTSPNGESITPVLHISRPVVRVAVNEYPPFVYKVTTVDEEGCLNHLVPCYARINTSNTLQEKMFCCFGASLDFLAFLQKDLNFEAYVYFSPDGQYGTQKDSTGQWNGIVGELVDGRAMLSLEMGLNKRRAHVISFAQPTLPLELGILVNKSDMRKVLSRDSWLHPFSTRLWLTLMGSSCTVLFVIWWLDRKSPHGHYHKPKSNGTDGLTLLDSVSYVGGVAFGKDIGPERTPLSTSSRLVAYVYSLLALIMINTYCANLMAFLVKENAGLPITGVDDPKLISEPPMFKAAAVRGSNEEDYFKNHINSTFRRIHEVNLRENSVSSLETGVEQMRQGKIQGLIGDYLSLSQIANTDESCSFKLLKERAPVSGYGFAVPKNSPWLQEISLSVLKHQENGMIRSIANRWFSRSVCNGNEHRRLDSSDFVGLFWTVIVVSVFSLLALLAEILTFFTLIKFGTSLGPLGRFLKRFFLNVRRGEEDHTLVHHQAALMETACDANDRQISFDNNGYANICELERKITSIHSRQLP